MRKKVLVVLGLLALAIAFAACAPHASQDTLKPAGPYAREEKDLFVPVFWVAVAVFVIVEGLIVFFLFKYRHREGQDRMPPQIHGNTRLEIGWTILPAVVLAVVMVPTVATIWDLARKPPSDALNVTVIGQQWFWKFEYTDPDMQTAAEVPGPITTSNELVIPTDRVVYLTVTAGVGGIVRPTDGASDAAVIHSFWVPELAGKQDAIPNHENHILLQADEPGIYEGQCAEFCGLSHAIMKFHVRAVTPEDFATWSAGQKEDAITPTGGLAASGFDAFMGGRCIECHAIQGTPAQGIAGPDLTHFASRLCMVGCLLDNQDREDIARWLRDPPAVKPGSFMPNYHLPEDEIQALVAYLQSLK
ncbi:MAG: cytochrome c oxidase subunit II [Actinomycetota bacterium]|nr:cytochrome c oxidase subunit II [Actinomycetota bacterium]